MILLESYDHDNIDSVFGEMIPTVDYLDCLRIFVWTNPWSDPLVNIYPVIEYFKHASVDDIARFRNRGSSLASVDQNCMQMMAIINSVKGSDFAPAEVKEWIESQDAQGTKQSREMIDEINGILFKDVRERLETKFGEDEKGWWMKGVPPKVRIECDQRLYEATVFTARELCRNHYIR